MEFFLVFISLVASDDLHDTIGGRGPADAALDIGGRVGGGGRGELIEDDDEGDETIAEVEGDEI